MLQWVIDTIGKLGPLAVAFAVFTVNLRQNKWSNTLARRSAEVEDQKFRLALIDRRISALEALRAAYLEWAVTGRASSVVAGHVEAALRVAQLMFDDEHEAEIDAAHRLIQTWQFHERQQARWRDRDEERLQAAIEAQMELDEPLGKALRTLEADLRKAAKVRTVPPIRPAAPSLMSWMTQRLRKTRS